MNVIFKQKNKGEDEFHELFSNRTLPFLPQPNDIILYIDRQWKVLDIPFVWNLHCKLFQEQYIEVFIERIYNEDTKK